MNPQVSPVFQEIINNRKSILPYQFEQGKRIPDEIIWQILENANRAPNHKHTEPWRFIVFTGEGLAYFAQLQAEIYTRYAGEKFKEKKLKNLQEYPLMTSHIIAVCMKKNEENKLPEIEETIAVGCAIENIYLSLTAYGLGGYLSTGGITYFKETRSHLGLADNETLIGFFYTGYVKAGEMPPAKRGAIQEKVRWIDQPDPTQ